MTSAATKPVLMPICIQNMPSSLYDRAEDLEVKDNHPWPMHLADARKGRHPPLLFDVMRLLSYVSGSFRLPTPRWPLKASNQGGHDRYYKTPPACFLT